MLFNNNVCFLYICLLGVNMDTMQLANSKEDPVLLGYDIIVGKLGKGSSNNQHATFLPPSSLLLAGNVYSTALLFLPGEYKEDI
jgi:hypothetical protein